MLRPAKYWNGHCKKLSSPVALKVAWRCAVQARSASSKRIALRTGARGLARFRHPFQKKRNQILLALGVELRIAQQERRGGARGGEIKQKPFFLFFVRARRQRHAVPGETSAGFVRKNGVLRRVARELLFEQPAHEHHRQLPLACLVHVEHVNHVTALVVDAQTGAVEHGFEFPPELRETHLTCRVERVGGGPGRGIEGRQGCRGGARELRGQAVARFGLLGAD